MSKKMHIRSGEKYVSKADNLPVLVYCWIRAWRMSWVGCQIECLPRTSWPAGRPDFPAVERSPVNQNRCAGDVITYV